MMDNQIRPLQLSPRVNATHHSGSMIRHFVSQKPIVRVIGGEAILSKHLARRSRESGQN